MKDTLLSLSISVEKYQDFCRKEDREAIANLIFERFHERYLEPFKNNKSKHGFSMMAIGCLMTEALFCYIKGRKRTGESGSTVFESFFSESNHLKQFSGLGDEFYRNIRCGILHQSETYGGWKIVRRGCLLQKSQKTINATKYLSALEMELQDFTESLKNEPFTSKKWKAAIKKLDHICENCQTK